MDKISRLTMLTFFPCPRQLDTLSHHWQHWRAYFLIDSNLSKVSTDAKSNPEFTKPKRREMPYCKDNHICVHGSDYKFAKCLSCKMRIVEKNARICLLLGTWLEISRYHSCHSAWRRSFHPLCWWSPFCQFRMHVCNRTDSETVNLC